MSDDEVYVNAGQVTVNLGHSQTLLYKHIVALGHVRKAKSHVLAAIGLISMAAPGQRSCMASLSQLKDLLFGPRGLLRIEAELEEQISSLRTTIIMYETLGFGTEASMRAIPGFRISGIERVLMTVWPPFAVGKSMEATILLNDAARSYRGAGLNAFTQRFVVVAATVFSAYMNILGKVTTRAGVFTQDELPAVPYAAATLSNMLGLDTASGNFKLSLTGTTATDLYSSEWVDKEAVSTVPINELAGTLTDPIRSEDDIFKRIDELGKLSKEKDRGYFEIIWHQGEGGRSAWIVLVPGMQGTLSTANPQSILNNLAPMANHDSNMSLAVQQALEMLPIQEDDIVSMTGHSQGGMIVMDVSKSLERTEAFRVRTVLTCGSPIGQFGPLSEKTMLLAVEDMNDLVPAIDGIANSASPNHVTAIVNTGAVTFGAAHGSDNCMRLVKSASRDPSVDPIYSEMKHSQMWDEEWVVARQFRFEVEATK